MTEQISLSDIPSLKHLHRLMKERHPATLDAEGEWRSDLPTFGGSKPEVSEKVWSWDEEHFIKGTGPDDLELINRKS